MKKNKYFMSLVVIIMVFLILFLYLGMNLKSRNCGYEIEKLLKIQKKYRSEVDKLLVTKERLINLERVERIARNKLNYKVPSPEQLIKVYVK